MLLIDLHPAGMSAVPCRFETREHHQAGVLAGPAMARASSEPRLSASTGLRSFTTRFFAVIAFLHAFNKILQTHLLLKVSCQSWSPFIVTFKRPWLTRKLKRGGF